MDDQETEKKMSKWSCSLCTYNNIAGQLTCDLCSTPRFAQDRAEKDVVRKQAELLTRQWSCTICTFENIQGAANCAKCDAERPAPIVAGSQSGSRSPSLVSTRPVSPEVATKSQRHPFIVQPEHVPPLICDAGSSSSGFKWKCSLCTYLNFPSAQRCTMCNSVATKPTKYTRPLRHTKEFFSPAPVASETHSLKRNFLVTGTLSRYMNFFTGHSHREDLFFRTLGAIVSSDPNALNEVVNYIISDGNVNRSLNLVESIIVYDYAENVSVACGDTLLTLARKVGLVEVQKLLERVSVPEDNLPCAAASPNSELFARIYHIFHFCRAPYNIPFRPYNFSIFRLPFPKNDFTSHFLAEIAHRNFDPSMRQSLLRYVQIAPANSDDVRLSTIASCPATLLMRNRGANRSFYDALMQAMFGVCDRTNVLRTQLHDHLNSHSDWYKSAFKCQMRLIAKKTEITLTDFELDELWLSCLESTTDVNRPIEAIHIFALSHLILRPIIVLPISAPMDMSKRPRNLLSLATSRSSSYHFLEGFYVPYYLKNEMVSRSPICLIHDNGQIFNWITNDEHDDGAQSFLIVNFPRTQFPSLYRFVEEVDEKQVRGFMTLSQLTPCSVAVRYTAHECIPEVTGFYFDYLHAAEKTLREQQSMRISDVMRQMSSSVNGLQTNPCITQMFNPTSKRLLSRRQVTYREHTSESSNDGESDDSLGGIHDDDETKKKVAKVNDLAG